MSDHGGTGTTAEQNAIMQPEARNYGSAIIRTGYVSWLWNMAIGNNGRFRKQWPGKKEAHIAAGQ